MVQLIKNYLFSNFTYERKIRYWSIVAQHGVIKIALFQKLQFSGSLEKSQKEVRHSPFLRDQLLNS